MKNFYMLLYQIKVESNYNWLRGRTVVLMQTSIASHNMSRWGVLHFPYIKLKKLGWCTYYQTIN